MSSGGAPKKYRFRYSDIKDAIEKEDYDHIFALFDELHFDPYNAKELDYAFLDIEKLKELYDVWITIEEN